MKRILCILLILSALPLSAQVDRREEIGRAHV